MKLLKYCQNVPDQCSHFREDSSKNMKSLAQPTCKIRSRNTEFYVSTDHVLRGSKKLVTKLTFHKAKQTKKKKKKKTASSLHYLLHFLMCLNFLVSS